MKVKDMKPGVAYATCDRRYVVPVEPIASDYRREVVEKDGKRVEVFTRDADGDPWQDCGPRKRGTKGVLVLAFDVDEHGKPVDAGHKQLISTRDFRGTWLEYLALHAEEVKLRGLARAKERERDAKRKYLTVAAKKAFGGVGTVSTHVYKGWGKDKSDEYNIDIRMNEAQFKRFMKEHA